MKTNSLKTAKEVFPEANLIKENKKVEKKPENNANGNQGFNVTAQDIFVTSSGSSKRQSNKSNIDTKKVSTSSKTDFPQLK